MPTNTLQSEDGVSLIEVTRMGGEPIRLLERSYLVTKAGQSEPLYRGADIGRAHSAFESALVYSARHIAWKK